MKPRCDTAYVTTVSQHTLPPRQSRDGLKVIATIQLSRTHYRVWLEKCSIVTITDVCVLRWLTKQKTIDIEFWSTVPQIFVSGMWRYIHRMLHPATHRHTYLFSAAVTWHLNTPTAIFIWLTRLSRCDNYGPALTSTWLQLTWISVLYKFCNNDNNNGMWFSIVVW